MVKFEGLLQNKYIKRLKIKYPARVGRNRYCTN